MRRPLRQNQEHRLAFCPTDSYDNKYTFRGFIQVSYPGLAEGKVTQKSFIVIRMTVRTFTQQIAINRIRSSTTLLSYCFSVRKPLVSQTIDPQRNRYQLIGDRADSWHMICTAHEHRHSCNIGFEMYNFQIALSKNVGSCSQALVDNSQLV